MDIEFIIGTAIFIVIEGVLIAVAILLLILMIEEHKNK